MEIAARLERAEEDVFARVDFSEIGAIRRGFDAQLVLADGTGSHERSICTYQVFVRAKLDWFGSVEIVARLA